MSRLRCGVAVLAVLLCGAAQAELRALLVGVSGYPTLAEHLQLQGPRNDVQRMRDVLMQRGFAAARIVVLADGVALAQAPTRANILAALDGLGAAAQAGDTVFLHFAGHGSRQPAGRDAADALMPIFLPLDVGSWDGQTRTVANAITGPELRERVDRITARGAFVWGVFDACHSATLVRGAAGDELRYRGVDPKALGIPAAELDRAAMPTTRSQRSLGPGALDTAPRAAGAGPDRSVFFYATQADELTPELRLPAGDPKRKPYGLFSFTVSSAIERGQTMSYRQLGQYVLAEYGSIAEAYATPLYSGTALDEAVFGQRTLPARQWPLAPGDPPSVPAGRLAGIVPGAVFALLPGPLARDDERIGHLQVSAAEAARAELVPLPFAGRPAPKAEELKPGQYLRLLHSPPEFGLRAALDARACAPDCALREAVALLRGQGVPGVDLQWVDAASGPDVLIRFVQGRAVFLTTTLQGADARTEAEAPGFGLHDGGRALTAEDLAGRLAQDLHRIARARNLLTLAARFAAEADGNGLAATLRQEGPGADAVLAPERVPRLRAGDQLALDIENRGPVALDLTVLYVDADHGIQTLFPSARGESNRIPPGAKRTIAGIQINAPPAGIERLLLISVPAQPHAERADFSFLQQPALTRRRGSAPEDLAAFADAAFADYRTRGAARPAAPGRGTGMQVFTLNVQR